MIGGAGKKWKGWVLYFVLSLGFCLLLLGRNGLAQSFEVATSEVATSEVASSEVAAFEIATFRLIDETVAPVNDRLFGHFLERASWGEPGPESAIQPGSDQLFPEAIALMRQMNIPLIRFPGGTDVDYTDWRDMVSNVPGRAIKGDSTSRPITVGHTGEEITNRFGLDEYFQLRDRLGTPEEKGAQDKQPSTPQAAQSDLTGESTGVPQRPETILVTNLLDALAKRVPLEEAALSAAGLVAYVNAPVGSNLPVGMPDWPAVRAQNGHPAPYGVEYLQLGNELWLERFQKAAQAGSGLSKPEDLAQWYLTCLKAYIAAIDAVDPNIALLLDANMGQGVEKMVLADSEIQGRIEYLTIHEYAPGPVDGVVYEDREIPNSLLIGSDWWKAWVAMPGQFSAAGENMGLGDRLALARSLGYKIAVTEWNWNGWNLEDIDLPDDTHWQMAAGLGTAGFLNGLMRQGADVAMACQSLLIGEGWDITSIRVDPDNREPPYFLTQGQITSFYSNHHGNRLLKLTSENVPSYDQPYSMGWVKAPKTSVATIDAVVTGDEKNIYLHAINRSQEADLAILLDLSSVPDVGDTAAHYLFTQRSLPNWWQSMWERVRSLWQPKHDQEIAEIVTRAVPLQTQEQVKALAVTLPKQSVSIFEIHRS